MTTNQTNSFQPAGPHAYATPHGVMPVPGGPVPPAPKRRNGIGIAAFVVAVLGFIFAVTEGAYILGWILLPIAFVLALVALCQRDTKKLLAFAALIISIVGTVAGVIAFTASAARVVDDALTGGEVTAAAPADQTGAGASDDAESTGSVAADDDKVGTRTTPYPLGTAISNDKWTVTVNSFDADATDAVLTENPYNDKPASGQAYALVNLTVQYIGDESGIPSEVGVSYVTSGGNTVNTFDALALAPDALSSNELYNGASATGNVALMIPEGDEGTLRVRPGFLGDEVFVSTT
jgi:hypothetical protein